MTDRPSASVRAFARDDLAAILGIELAAYDERPFPGMTRDEVAMQVGRLGLIEDGTVVAVEDGSVVGVCTPRFHLLTVHPAHRRRGHGRRLVEAARILVAGRGLAELELWGDADREPGAPFIRALGFRYRSSLWLFRMSEARTVPRPVFPPSVTVRPLDPQADTAPYATMIATAFADHPSPLQVSEPYLRAVHALPDFDPSDVLLLCPSDEPDRIVGFCRTIELPADGERRRGDIGLVGLVPEWRGRGLGRQLLRWGIAHLRDRGMADVELSVEARNESALALYRSEGFVPAVEWRHWVLPAAGAAGDG